MSTLFLVLQFVFAILLTIAILLQKSSSIGLGAYSGSNESLFGAKGPAGFLAKFTFFVGATLSSSSVATCPYCFCTGHFGCVSFDHVFHCFGKAFVVKVGNAHVLQILSDDHAKCITEFFHVCVV